MTAQKKITVVDEQKAEATESEAPAVEFDHDGETYTVERDALDNLELFEAVEDEKYLVACRGFIGDAQWAKFKEAHRNERGRIPMSAASDFLQKLMDAIGSGNF